MLRLRAPIAATAVLMVTALGCGPGKDKRASKPSSPSAEKLESRLAGSYRISSSKLVDTCGGGIFMATETIEYSPEKSALIASEVGRSYQAEIEGDELVARGRFRRRKDCPVYEAVETWRFIEGQNGHMTGTLRSLWRLDRRDCLKACKVVFEITAAPAGEVSDKIRVKDEVVDKP